MSSLRPFEISISQEHLELLKEKLLLASFPDELDDAGWDLGAPLADVKRLAAYWKDGFDWKKQETLLNNELPQFTTDITVDGFDGLEIHLVYQKSAIKGAIPLLFIHGCMPFIRDNFLLRILLTNLQGRAALWKFPRYCHF